MRAEMLGAVHTHTHTHTSNLINQKTNNKYRSILYLCNFAMQK